MTQDSHLTIADFGLAKMLVPKGLLLAPGTESAWVVKETVGTLEYMSPETLTGQLSGTKADIYAVGCIGIEMLTGRVSLLRFAFHDID